MRILNLAFALLLVSSAASSAADLRVYSGGAPQDTLKLLAPEFEKTTQHRLQFTFAVVGAIQQRLEAGETADVVLLPVPLIEALDKAGKLRPGSRSLLARVGIAVVVREGAAKPDVSTPRHCARHCSPHARSPMPIRRRRRAAATSPRCSPAWASRMQRSARSSQERHQRRRRVHRQGRGRDRALPPERSAHGQRRGRRRHAAGRAAELYRLFRRRPRRQPVPDAAAEFIKFVADPSREPQWQATGFESVGKHE